MSRPLPSVPEGWVDCGCGSRHWGRFGAAGLLVSDGSRVVLQHRATWSHQGGTWALPGGAIAEGETALAGALREAQEEASIPASAVQPVATSVLSHPDWSYTTVLARIAAKVEVAAADAESIEVIWTELDQVEQFPLLPAFAQAWPTLRTMIGQRPAVLVDAANVVGSRPDGWWRDRAGANARLVSSLDALASTTVPASFLGLAGTHWWPSWHVVVEGAARGVAGTDRVQVHPAPGSGDDTLVARALSLAHEGFTVCAVTADRELITRLRQAGAAIASPRKLLNLLS